jgi:tetraacyldisaccharide-1-P 4'-kinase
MFVFHHLWFKLYLWMTSNKHHKNHPIQNIFFKNLYPQIPRSSGISLEHLDRCYDHLIKLSLREEQFQPEISHQKPIHLCIESLSWGGAGKTQLLIDLSKKIIHDFLESKPKSSLRLALICHGYGTSKNTAQCIQYQADLDIFELYQQYGDEFALIYLQIQMLYQKHKSQWDDIQIALIVGGRWKDKAALAEQQNYDFCIYDGGGWRKDLKRQGTLIILDDQIPWRLIPWGVLKSPIIPRDDLLYIINHIDEDCDFDRFQAFRHYCFSKYQYQGLLLRTKEGDISLKIDQVKGMKIHLFSAIAKPLALQRQLQKLGFQIIKHIYVPDHESIPQAMHYLNDSPLRMMQQSSSWNTDLIYPCTTAKDYVKFPNFSPIFILEIEMFFINHRTLT